MHDMEKLPSNPDSIEGHEKVRKSYIDSIEHIIPFDWEEERTQEEVVGWLRDTNHVTKKESPEQHLGVVALIVNPKMDKVFFAKPQKGGGLFDAWWACRPWRNSAGCNSKGTNGRARFNS